MTVSQSPFRILLFHSILLDVETTLINFKIVNLRTNFNVQVNDISNIIHVICRDHSVLPSIFLVSSTSPKQMYKPNDNSREIIISAVWGFPLWFDSQFHFHCLLFLFIFVTATCHPSLCVLIYRRKSQQRKESRALVTREISTHLTSKVSIWIPYSSSYKSTLAAALFSFSKKPLYLLFWIRWPMVHHLSYMYLLLILIVCDYQLQHLTVSNLHFDCFYALCNWLWVFLCTL